MRDFEPDFTSPPDWASMYRETGMQVIPAHYPREDDASFPYKRPSLKWSEFQETRMSDAVFQRWYGPKGTFRNSTQMGILTGSCSGNIGVVDLDLYKSPAAAAWWEDVRRTPVETCEQITGGGGIQFLFCFPADFVIPTFRTSIGIDVRGQGGFAMLPPSRHASGKLYRWREGFGPWECEIQEAPQWLCEAVMDLYREHGGTGATGPREHIKAASELSPFGSLLDGREDYMTRMIWAAVVNWHRECPIKPPENESTARMRDVYGIYERGVASRIRDPGIPKSVRLEREGRGATMFADKWQSAMRLWATKVRVAAGEPRLSPEEPVQARAKDGDDEPKDETNTEEEPDVYPLLDLPAIATLAPPTWLVDGLIPERGLTFLYGAPGKGKTFVVKDISLSVAHGMDWQGIPTKKGGVLYIAGEGVGGLRNRVIGWHRANGLEIDNAPFRLLPAAVNLMDHDAVARLVRTIKLRLDGAAMVVIDTVARAIAGAEENASKEMGLFVSACDAIRKECGVAVLGVHHTGKDEDRGMRGSSALEGAGDAVILLRREENSQFVTLEVRKQKDGEAIKPIVMEMQKVEWVEGMDVVSTLVPRAAEPTKPGSPLDRDMCRRILSLIQIAWDDGQPLSHKSRAKSDGHYAPRVINRETGVKAGAVEALILAWLDSGTVGWQVQNTTTKRAGLKVLRWDI